MAVNFTRCVYAGVRRLLSQALNYLFSYLLAFRPSLKFNPLGFYRLSTLPMINIDWTPLFLLLF